jgi:hypothetical protein
MLCSLSDLDTSKLAEIQSLEKELDKTLLSFSCHDINPDEIQEDALEKIKTLEQRLGVSLVAVT